MKKSTFLRSLLTLLVMAVWGGANGAMAQSYIKVTSTDQLVFGGKYLIVNAENGVAMSTTQNKNNRGMTSVTITNEEITSIDNSVAIFELGKRDTYYTLNDEIGYLYAASSSSNYLRTKETADNDCKAEITFDAEGNASIVFKGSYSRNVMRYNSSSSLFACYDANNNQKNVQLYTTKDDNTPQKTAPQLSYEQDLYSITAGEEFQAPALVNPNNVNPIAYTSSNTTIASVDENGDVTLTGGYGSTIITASFAGDDTYSSGEASYTLNVNAPVGAASLPFSYNEGFSSIAYTLGLTYSDIASGNYNTDNTKLKFNTEGAFLLLEIKDGETPTFLSYDIKRNGTTDGCTFTTYTSIDGSNFEELLVLTSDDIKNAESKHIFIELSSDVKYIKWEYTTKPSGTNFGLGNIYVGNTSASILTISTVGYATFSAESNYIIPAGIEGGIVTVEGTTANVDYVYTEGDIVPANTGLLMKGEAGEYKMYATTQEATEVYAENLLQGALTNDVITAPTGTLLYILAKDDSKHGLGFYWQGSSEGKQVQNMAGKAYLQVPTTSAVQGFRLNLGDTTGISAVETTNGNAPVYTLSGVRVNGNLNNLPAGIYIVGGKKVYVK